MKNLDLLVPQQQPAKNGDTWVWATVTQVSPLRIRLDGDAAALPVTPENLAYGLSVNQRVWVQLSGHRIIVHGANNGTHAHDYAATSHTHSNYSLTTHTHAVPKSYVNARSYADTIGNGSSYSNGSYTTIGIWEPGPTWAGDIAMVNVSFNARSDVNAAAYHELLVHTGTAWTIFTTIRVHNNGQPTLGLGGSMTIMLRRDECPSISDCRIAVNMRVDSGGGWIATGPVSAQITFLKNVA